MPDSLFDPTHWPSRGSPAGEIVYGIPARQQQLLEIVRKQLGLVEATARRQEAVQLKAAHIVAAEIGEERRALETAVSGLATNTATALDDLATRVDHLGYLVSEHLEEIAWSARQMAQTLDSILATLRGNRKNEAQQLVQQGIRLYEYKDLDEAERCFVKAYEFDATDYQVLMNLGYVPWKRDQGDKAAEWFRRAAILPPHLDDSDRGTAFLEAAWTLYRAGQFARAHAEAERAIRGLPTARAFYKSAVYAGLSGSVDLAMSRLKEAIVRDPRLFYKAYEEALDKDLRPVKPQVLRLLDELALAQERETKSRLVEVARVVHRIRDRSDMEALASTVMAVDSGVDRARQLITSAGYSRLVGIGRNLVTLSEVMTEIGGALPVAQGQRALKAELAAQIDELSDCEIEARKASKQAEWLFNATHVVGWPALVLGVLFGIGLVAEGGRRMLAGVLGMLAGPDFMVAVAFFTFYLLPGVVWMFLALKWKSRKAAAEGARLDIAKGTAESKRQREELRQSDQALCRVIEKCEGRLRSVQW